MARSKALAKTESSEFQALATTPIEDDGMFSQKELKESMGTAPPSTRDFQRLKVPAGGSLAWEIIDENGEPDSVKSFDAIIVAAQDMRLFYAKKYSGGNEPPDCVSLDLINGAMNEDAPADITGLCATCPKNKWGSAVDESGEPTKGKACQERKQLLLLRPNDLMPCLLSVPPSSLASVQSYIRRLPAMIRRPFYGVVTTFELEKQKSDNGIPYSRVKLSLSRPLNADEVAAVRMLRDEFGAAIEVPRSEEV